MGIEVAQSNNGIVISQRKYALNLLEETGLMNSKSVDTPMDSNAKLLPSQGEPLSDLKKYRRLVAKFNYLIVTRLDISFAVGVVSQFLNSSCVAHLNAVTHNNNNNNYKHNNNNINNDNTNNINCKNKNKRNNNNNKIILLIIIVIIIIIIFARIGLIHQAGELHKTRGQFFWRFFDRVVH